ncbi:MAG TPA: hypothetical protein VK163_07720 [Opitutaceae bacterium]|nr:hypothetical protein [Opitutaceae bacterium]
MKHFLLPLALFGAGLALAEAGTTSASVPYRWDGVAIGGGGLITGIEFHPQPGAGLFVRTDVGGAYRWDEAGGRWVSLTDWINWKDANLMGIESFALDPRDPQRLFLAAGTYNHPAFGHGAMLRSTDAGRTFARASIPLGMGGNEIGRGGGERLAVDPHDGRILFFGSRDAGLWRSADGGQSWQRVETFPAVATAPGTRWRNEWLDQAIGIGFVAFDPASGGDGQPTQALYAGVSIAGTQNLFRSTDAGATWQPVPGQPTTLRPTRASFGPDGALYVVYGSDPCPNVMTDGAVWKLEPGVGDRWTDITPIKPGGTMQFGYSAIAFDPAHRGTMLVTTWNKWAGGDEVYRTTDGGKTWHPTLTGAEWDKAGVPWIDTMKPHWICAVALDPANPDRALFGTGYGVWETRNLTAVDRGERVKWTFSNRGLEETVPLALLSPPQGAPLLSGVGDIDGFRHDDLAVSPLQHVGPRFTGTDSLACAAAKPEFVVRTGHIRNHQAGQIRGAFSEDGGNTWAAFVAEPPGEGDGRITVSVDGATIIWTPRAGSAHWSRNRGATWTPCAGLAAGTVVMADGANPKRFYAFDAATSRLRVSEDGGATFTPRGKKLPAIGPAPGGFADGFTAELVTPYGHDGEVWLSIRGSALFRSTNAGKSFRAVASTKDIHSFGFGAPAPGRTNPAVYAAGVIGVDGLFRSIDDGATWQRIDDDAHRFAWIYAVTGDARVFGRVYFATVGRGIIYGVPAE